MKNSRAMIILLGLVLGCVLSLVNCGRQSDEESGNPSSYPGNFLTLCAQQDKSAELLKTFNALLEKGETCLDAHTRLMALDEIDLSGKELSDIRPLASFIAVKTLYLDHNRIGSLAALSGLYKLEKLDVSWNDIDDISFLDELARLETLYVFGNPLGNKVAKTADNCPYQDVGKGLKEFCTPPASKRKKPRVIVVKKTPTKSTPSRTKSSSKDSSSQTSHDDSTEDPHNESPSQSDKSQNQSQNQNNQEQEEPEQEDKPTPKTKAKKVVKDPTDRKRAWEKDTSFLPPEDDENDDWGEDVDQDRGLVADMAADDSAAAAKPGKKDVDEAMAKEADKELGEKPAKVPAGAKAQAQRENPFATTAKGRESLAGQQTVAHSWDQAISRAFADKNVPADQPLEIDSTGLGQTIPGRRVPATDLFGEAFGDESSDASGLDAGGMSLDGTTKDQNDSLLGKLTELYPRKPEAKQDSAPKSWFDRLAMSFTGSNSDSKKSPAAKKIASKKPAVKASQAIKIPAKVQEAGTTVVPKTTRQTEAPIKSFLAYCLDHSEQPAIAHTIKVLTMTGESCIDSFRRLSALKRLDLAKRQLTDIAPLASFKNLEQLDLADNRIASIKPLTGLQKLKWLNLDRNNLGDISHLSRLAALSHLTAEHNRIFSLKPLSGLKNLGTIAVKGNPIAKDAAKNSITCPVAAASSTLRSFCQL